MICRFCDFESKEPQLILATRAHTLVVLSNPRLMFGHLLVIPRRHVISLAELNEEERREIFDTAIEYQEKIMRNIAPGCDIRQHNRPFLPESDLKVDHIHLHLQPRSFDDELYMKSEIHSRELFKSPTHEEMDTFRNLLKA